MEGKECKKLRIDYHFEIVLYSSFERSNGGRARRAANGIHFELGGVFSSDVAKADRVVGKQRAGII